MTAIDFPDSPSLNDTFSSGGRTWIWNGTVWNTVTTQAGPTGPTGPTGADGADNIVSSATAPANTDVLWIDTDEPGDAVLPLAGTTGQVLAKASNSDYDTEWVGATPVTTQGDLIVGDAGGAESRLAIGTSGQILESNGTTLSYVTPDSSPADIITTQGDLIIGDGSGDPSRLAIGTSGQILASDGTTATWQDNPAIPETLIDAAGDLIVGTANDTAGRLGKGGSGSLLYSDSSNLNWLPVGTTGKVLSSTGSALTWADPPSAGETWTLLSSGGTTQNAKTVSISGLSGYNKYLVRMYFLKQTAGNQFFAVRLNNSNTNYNYAYTTQIANASWSAQNVRGGYYTNFSDAYVGWTSTNASNSFVSASFEISGADNSGLKKLDWVGGGYDPSTGDFQSYQGKGWWNDTAIVTSIEIYASNFFQSGGAWELLGGN